jgi:hypothetical protein
LRRHGPFLAGAKLTQLSRIFKGPLPLCAKLSSASADRISIAAGFNSSVNQSGVHPLILS